MSNRSAKFASAIFVSILAGVNLATVTDIRAQTTADKTTADNCLSSPKSTTSAGGHWYYRIDRATKRQCWYLREENDKTARAAPQDSSPTPAASSATPTAATDPAPRQTEANVRKSIADARAELPSPQARVEPNWSTGIEPPKISAAPAARIQQSPPATALEADTPPPSVASRWPDASTVNSFDHTRTAAVDPPASAPANAKAAPRAAPAPVALAVADSSAEKQSGSMQMLLLVMVGALALAGITASLVFRLGRVRAPRPELRHGRRVIWDTVPARRPSPSMGPSPSTSPGEDVPMWRSADSRDPRAPDDPERRVTEMLARLARSAQT